MTNTTMAFALSGQSEFRQLMGSFPTGVTVITAMADDGPRGMTCSSLTSVCLDPATLAVCLRTDSVTLGAVARHGHFAVNLLHARAERAARVFSSAAPDRFGVVRWHLSGTGLPLLSEDAFAYAECHVAGTADVGDHTMVFGTVATAWVLPGSPLVYARRLFRSWDALPPPAEGQFPALTGAPTEGDQS
jgi:flavin reductase (DIM6/NTAB) family NADH-FMN oxidoreductase RutF